MPTISQKSLSLRHLQLYHSIEPMTALAEYGCYRLGARIADLRAEGYLIDKELVPFVGKITGNHGHYAKYTLLQPEPVTK